MGFSLLVGVFTAVCLAVLMDGFFGFAAVCSSVLMDSFYATALRPSLVRAAEVAAEVVL
eukprot:CAMPEP_0202007274 /NCGR_PEP_ID=MMETSP0905-20130828/11813_1 /ASSEMBLY_ACC=CAM_ASM_000554 /TAXON_ID=420261 /ORGANISM="Thalassiosira antarctica, Strain CCMP982" /LENGTH=58 /DNA_ID=CAMNT_0048565207 /DNA_START=225 /DNA_END=398 /DNA_ORIENTATION=-